MPIELISKIRESIPVDVREISTSFDKSITQIASTLVHYGNRDVELGELFNVRGKSEDGKIIWEGDLRHVHHIGYQMDRGEMLVIGSTGNHLGREMSGGQITVRGDVGDHAGGQLRGGLIRVYGNAGDQLGGSYPGAKFGMNRGTILIAGNAGTATGNAMRRGLIAIGGGAMSGLGTNMLAGTIVVSGRCHAGVGLNMKRGTIVVANPDRSSTEMISPVNFRKAGLACTQLIRLLANWLEIAGFEFAKERLIQQHFEQFAGDQVCGGRGELFFPA